MCIETGNPFSSIFTQWLLATNIVLNHAFPHETVFYYGDDFHGTIDLMMVMMVPSYDNVMMAVVVMGVTNFREALMYLEALF